MCSSRYDSHDWQLARGNLVCSRCGLVDLGPARVRKGIGGVLAKRGIRVTPKKK
jgi:hypothetical protein